MALSLFAARDAPAHAAVSRALFLETSASSTARPDRIDAWANRLDPIDVTTMGSHDVVSVRFYDRAGNVDDGARAELERVAAGAVEAHGLSLRVERLLVKAAYHFGGARVVIVSGWRARAGRHGTGEAIDFKLQGVRASVLAAYLRELPRVGVGIYTHPKTQFVHLDVRDPSFHWIDASPPGVKWRERQLGDAHAQERDASWTSDMDLPL
ncbi:MAG TPA: DUF882 domain-containing protein [Polyangiaceae bacterium]|nr:DUF882 domain-containing protein [Polyangiaceae bacterium]